MAARPETIDDPIAAGGGALARGAWAQAREAFESALAREETPEAPSQSSVLLLLAALPIDSWTGILAALLAAIGASWALLRWLNRPKFICGIPPSSAEMKRHEEWPKKLGEPSLEHQFRHRRTLLAQRLRPLPRRLRFLFRRVFAIVPPSHREASQRRKGQLTYAELADLLASESHREVQVANGKVTLPILLINIGGRTANDLLARVVLIHPDAASRAHVTDVITEGLDYYLYAARPDLIASSLMKAGKAADQRIVDAYNDYLGGYEYYGDSLWITGNLAPRNYELALVTLQVTPTTRSFFVLYTLDAAEAFVRAQYYVQACTCTTQ